MIDPELGTWLVEQTVEAVYSELVGKVLSGAVTRIWPKAGDAQVEVAERILHPALQIPSHRIRGRDEMLSQIDRAFRDVRAPIALHGSGGFGKSALAEEYARRQAIRGRYQGVWRISAVSGEQALADYNALAGHFSIAPRTDLNRVVGEVVEQLVGDPGRWLLIHDNADDPDEARRLPERLIACDSIDHLITGRLTKWDRMVHPIPVDVLAPDEALALLAQEAERAMGTDADADLRRLAVETLDRLPLALVVSGRMLRDDPNLTVADLHADLQTLLAQAPETGAYAKSVYVAVTESVTRLQAANAPGSQANSDALALLRLAAFMNPDDIDEGFLVEGAKAVAARVAAGDTDYSPLPEPLAGLAGQKLRRSAAWARLDQLSLTLPWQWEGTRTRRLHRTTQRVLRDGMGEAAAVQIGLVGRLGRAQFSDNPQYDTPSWPRCRRLARHALALAPRAAEAAPGDRRVAAGLVHESALYLRVATGDLRLVRQMYQDNLAAMAAAHGARSLGYAAALQTLGHVLDHLGEDAAAEARLIEARNLTVDLLGPDDPSCAYDHASLGGFYRRRRRFAEAKEAFSESLRLLDAPGVAGELAGGAHGNLGTLYSDWADAAPGTAAAARHRALALYHKIEGLARTRAALGDLALDTALRHHTLHLEYRTLGEADPALAHGLRAAAIPLAMVQAGTIGVDHPQIALFRGHLAITLRELGREGELDALLAAEVAALEAGTALDITPERTARPGEAG